VSFARSQSQPAAFTVPAGDQGAQLTRSPVAAASESAAAPVLAPRHTLPTPPTPLIGRAADVAAVRNRLLNTDVRLESLLGPPGVGKTRLALWVATDLADSFTDGVIFVALAPVSN